MTEGYSFPSHETPKTDEEPSTPQPKQSAHSKLQKNLWLAGIALFLFIATLAIGNFFVSADKAVTRKSAGHDFLAFYTGGQFVRTGRTAELYNLDSIRAYQKKVALDLDLELPKDVLGPFWNPPFFAWVFVPLSALSYPTAWNVWFAINIVCLIGAMVILCRMLPRDWRVWGLVPLLTVCSPPFIQAMGHGQNTCLSLLLLCGAVSLWRSQRPIAAGIVTGLLFYKPQLGAILAVAMIIDLGWKPLAGLAIAGATLFLTTILTLPGSLSDYLRRLPDNIAYMQVDHRYYWDRHVTLKAFWRLLLQGYTVGELTPLTRALYLSSVAALAAFLFVTIWKLRSNTAARDTLIAATIVTMPLLMPFYFDYDLLLLTAAAVLCGTSALSGTGDSPVSFEKENHGRVARATSSRLLLANWIILFIWTSSNPAVSNMTHVNISVLLLTTLAAQLLSQARTFTAPTFAQTLAARSRIATMRLAPTGATP